MKNSFKTEDDDNRERIDSNGSGVDFLPIHCIIQTVSRIEDVRTVSCDECDNGGGRSDAKNWWECDCKNIEMSGCVVIPEDTSIKDFVKTVLVKLGYPSASSSFASGSILIRNWKPLSLKTICPGMNKSVGDILGELTAVVSLRIQIFRPKITIIENIKDSLLSFLVRANQHFLVDSGCPFDIGTLKKLCNPSENVKPQLFQEPSEDMREKFYAWLKMQRDVERDRGKFKSQINCSPDTNVNTNNNNNNNHNNKNSNVNTNNNTSEGSNSERKRNCDESRTASNGLVASGRGLKVVPPETCGKYLNEPGKEENSLNMYKESTSRVISDRPKLVTAQKTRIRTSFDPDLELPKLHKWYLKNPHPNRQQIYEYVSELNSLESRRGKKQLDVNNVLYWFKNARAAQKRTECRRGSTASIANSPKSGSVLKIPLGKPSGISSDDQRSLSDDDVSVISEPVEDFRSRNDRCLQVVGKWNSNGQGEAVLEMQIGSHKNDFVESTETTKKDQASENEETSRSASLSTDDDSIDPVQRLSPSEKKDLFSHAPEMDEKKEKELNIPEKSEIGANEKTDSFKNDEVNEDASKEDGSTATAKQQVTTPMGPFVGEDGGAGDSTTYVPPYKSADERRKRNRTFIDPVTEVPRLEEWFRLSTHPTHNLIARYTDELNSMPYRRKFPKLETKNVQFWFKNRRAKNKRLNYIETNK